jgi:hypothetical protein
MVAYNILGHGSSPVFDFEYVLLPAVSICNKNNNKSVNIIATNHLKKEVDSTPQMLCIQNVPQAMDMSNLTVA